MKFSELLEEYAVTVAALIVMLILPLLLAIVLIVAFSAALAGEISRSLESFCRWAYDYLRYFQVNWVWPSKDD